MAMTSNDGLWQELMAIRLAAEQTAAMAARYSGSKRETWDSLAELLVIIGATLEECLARIEFLQRGYEPPDFPWTENPESWRAKNV